MAHIVVRLLQIQARTHHSFAANQVLCAEGLPTQGVLVLIFFYL